VGPQFATPKQSAQRGHHIAGRRQLAGGENPGRCDNLPDDQQQ